MLWSKAQERNERRNTTSVVQANPGVRSRRPPRIEAVEEALGLEAKRELLPLQDGDVPDTFADVSELIEAVDYKPATPVKEGVRKSV